MLPFFYEFFPVGKTRFIRMNGNLGSLTEDHLMRLWLLGRKLSFVAGRD